MDGLYEHPMYYVVGKTGTVNIALLPIGWFYNQMTHW